MRVLDKTRFFFFFRQKKRPSLKEEIRWFFALLARSTEHVPCQQTVVDACWTHDRTCQETLSSLRRVPARDLFNTELGSPSGMLGTASQQLTSYASGLTCELLPRILKVLARQRWQLLNPPPPPAAAPGDIHTELWLLWTYILFYWAMDAHMTKFWSRFAALRFRTLFERCQTVYVSLYSIETGIYVGINRASKSAA